jgi:hypothetical protein
VVSALFFAPDSVTGVQGGVMTNWYPGLQMAVAWLLTVAVAGVIYFVPMTRLVDSLGDRSATITAAE